MTSFSIFRQHLKIQEVFKLSFEYFWIYYGKWRVCSKKSKCSIFHNIFKYMIFQRPFYGVKGYYWYIQWINLKNMDPDQFASSGTVWSGFIMFPTVTKVFWHTFEIIIRQHYQNGVFIGSLRVGHHLSIANPENNCSNQRSFKSDHLLTNLSGTYNR